MKLILLPLTLPLLLVGCSAFLPGDPAGYARNVPESCEAKLAEIEDLGGSVVSIRTARVVKEGAIALVPVIVALEVVHPAVALAPAALKAFQLDDAGRQKRIDFLVDRYYEQGCAPLTEG